jgi:flagellar biosynthesis/type III secretory pathway protein FliH
MTTDRLYDKSAAEIMVWLDGNPSAPFTIERKWTEEQLALKLAVISDRAADEDDSEYQMGYDEGRSDGRCQAEEDYQNEIRELEEQVNDLEREIEDLKEEAASAFAEGFETGSRIEGAETIELS